MEPVNVIVSALAAGAQAALPDTAKQGVKDAYEALKSLLKRKFAAVDVTPVERNPESENKRGSVAEDLRGAGADRDRDVLAAANQLLDLVRRHAPDAARSVGVDLENVRARGIELGNVAAAGASATGVRLRRVEATDDIRIRDVRAIGDAESPSNPC